MWNRLLEHKKKLIAAILVAILAIAGINLSDEQQATIVDTAAKVLPDAPAKTAP